MFVVDASSAEGYLRSTKRIPSAEPVEITELPGGVSNMVLLVRCPNSRGADFVLKQARGQLRVAQPWFCSVERIWREVETLRICQDVLAVDPEASVTGVREELNAKTPDVLWEDRENHLFAMSAAPPHTVWKYALMGGNCDERIASACGKLLGRLHAGTWRDTNVAARLADKAFFVDLRVEPYYRRIAEVHPELREHIEQLIQSVCETSLCLVHGDFSPKNLLVYDGGLMLVDCEVGHFGDPAFDLGFFFSHLSLKAIVKWPEHTPYLALVQSFWNTYMNTLAAVVSESERRALEQRAIANLAGCVLARVDGKSPVEYLNDLRLKEAARRFSYRLFQEPPAAWEGAEPLLREICESLHHATFWQDSRP